MKKFAILIYVFLAFVIAYLWLLISNVFNFSYFSISSVLSRQPEYNFMSLNDSLFSFSRIDIFAFVLAVIAPLFISAYYLRKKKIWCVLGIALLSSLIFWGFYIYGFFQVCSSEGCLGIFYIPVMFLTYLLFIVFFLLLTNWFLGRYKKTVFLVKNVFLVCLFVFLFALLFLLIKDLNNCGETIGIIRKWQDKCYVKEAVLNNNPQTCNFTKLSRVDWCYSNVAKALNDDEICEFARDKEYCYSL